MDPLLSIENLSVDVTDRRGRRRAILRGVDLALEAGEALALVGESGSGKTMLARAILRLLPPRAKQRSGRICLKGEDLGTRDEAVMGAIRGGRIGMVFQDPASALDPVQTVGGALREALHSGERRSAREIRRISVGLLEEVSLPDPERALDQYPHRLSGGMRQRVMIAIALARRPDLLLADEPTVALDHALEREVLDLLDRLRRERGLTVLLITHDLQAAARRCGRIAVMYAGRIVEEGPAKTVLESPGHPYTAALRECLEGRRSNRAGHLPVIPGQAPELRGPDERSCSFAPRCVEVFGRCRSEDPPPYLVGDVRVRCFLREAR